MKVGQLLKVGLVNKVREAERKRNPAKQDPELVFGIDDELPKQNFSRFLKKNNLKNASALRPSEVEKKRRFDTKNQLPSRELIVSDTLLESFFHS